MITQFFRNFLTSWVAIRGGETITPPASGVGKEKEEEMSCRIGYTETDFNLGIVDLDLLSPDQRGEDGEDEPYVHGKDEDGVWRSNPDRDRAAQFADSDHDLALRGPTRFRVIPLDMGDTRFHCRNRPVETTAYYNPSYRVGPPLTQ
jgi:hypothetical protein